LLSLGVDADLVAPLGPDFAVPTKEQLKAGHRSPVLVPQRQMMALRDHVSPLTFASETSSGEHTGWLRRKAAKSVRTWQVGTEIRMEMARGKALEKMSMVAAAPTDKKQDAIFKAARKADKEVAASKKLRWLMIQEHGV